MADQYPAIGTLRWPVTLFTRQQTPDADSAQIEETPITPLTVHADIQPLGPMVFYGAANAKGDEAPTHVITFRWQDYPDTTHAITRVTNLPGGGVRTETFRVRRILEIGGRKRFIRVEAQLERSISI